MWSKIKKAIKEPRKVFPYVCPVIKDRLLDLRRSQVKRTELNGKVFYKYKGVLYPEFLNNGNAMAFILEKAKQYCKGRGIDIGTSQWPFSDAIPIQNEEHQNAYTLDAFPNGSLDYVFSSHCLEHLERWRDALRLWINKIKTGGILFLYLPHKSMKLWRPGEPWVGYEHKWAPTYKIINRFLTDNRMSIVEFNSGKDDFYCFHIIAKKI